MVNADSEILTGRGGLEAAIDHAAKCEEAAKPSLVQRLRNHKILAYLGINAALGPVSIAASYISVKWLQLHEVMANTPIIQSTGDYRESFTAAVAGGAADFAVDIAIAPILYAVNRDVYTENTGKAKEFGKRYLAFTVLTKAIDVTAAGAVLGTMLTFNVPPGIAFATAGKAVMPLTVSARVMLYNTMVLKSHPVPEKVRETAQGLAERIKGVAYAAGSAARETAITVKRAAYTALTFTQGG